MVYFGADEYGNPDFSRALTRAEHEEAYWSGADSDPQSLADLYLDFHDFDQTEFLLFKDRLSAAILVARSAMKSTSHMRDEFEKHRRDKSHRVPGWEAESDLVLDESLGVIEDAQKIAIGAAMLSAVAALELLLKELSPKVDDKAGLDQVLQHFLMRQKVTSEEFDNIVAMVARVRKRRNAFAHTLIGSYWAQRPVVDMFTPEALEDTLHTVATTAIALEALLH